MAARRTRQALRANAEAQTLATLASSVLHGEDRVDAMLEQAREMFGMTSVSLLQRSDGAVGSVPRGPACTWTVAASAGRGVPPARPEDADVNVDVGDEFCLALRGRDLSAEDRRVLGAFAAQAAAVLEHHRLALAAEAGKPAAEAGQAKGALFATISNDMRGPLAVTTAAVSSLRAPDATWTAPETAGLLASAAESLGQLTRLAGNLLEMSRLQAGTLPLRPRPAGVAGTIAHAVASLGPRAAEVTVATPEGLPRVIADPALLERVLASLLSNAIRYSPAGMAPAVTASTLGDRLEMRVIDRGPAGTSSSRNDAELGLALARGLVEAMHGTLTPEETPGGGLTMTVSLPTATAADSCQTRMPT